MVVDFIDRFEVFSDPNFVFNPIQHKYTYNGVKYISVTQFLKNFHEEFDTDFWSKRKSDERGIDQEIILKEWKDKNDYANYVGTETHNWVENYFNRVYQGLPTNLDVIDRINKFHKIYYDKLVQLTPIKFEQRVFSTKWDLAGTFDALFSYKDSLVIVDWKTNKKFDTDNKWGKKLLEPFETEDECKLTEYSIQISLYALMLEEIGLDVKMGYILYIGPEEDPVLHRFKDYRDKLRTYFETLGSDV